MNFKNIKLSDEVKQSIKELNFESFTQIQEESLPAILEGKDVLGESATGSGKTLAFGAGAVETVVHGEGIQALIVTPTRELAEQVKVSLEKIAKHKRVFVTSIYGGVAMDPQVRHLKKADIVVATPGRLLDHLERGNLNTSSVKMLVLDEADRMLDMGFIDDIERIMRACPEGRQTLFFSATISSRIKELSRKFMKDPVMVTAVKMVDPTKLKQVYYDVRRNVKLSLLVHLLEEETSDLVMVFCNSRKTVDVVVDTLKSQKIRAIALHGGYSQNKRNRTIEQFNSERGANVLVCTDVAARGLHIDNVSHVYNYDIPRDSTDYVHRIGRTARAGSEGMVINLLCDYDHENFARVKRDHRDYDIGKVERPYLKELVRAVVGSPRRDSDRGSRGGFSRGRSSGPRDRFSRDSDRGPSRDRGRSPSRGPRRDGQRKDSRGNYSRRE